MAYGDSPDRRRDVLAALASVGLTLLVAVGLAARMADPVSVHRDEAISAMTIRLPPPEPDPEPTKPEVARPRPAAHAAPPARRARPTPVIAAPAPLPSPTHPATVVAEGSAPAAGASTAGPGTGAGGQGSGLGSGGAGRGDGGGGTRPTWRSGAITWRDTPPEARRDHAHGTVEARLELDAQGRVTHCSIMRSSGRADFDETTCRLIIERMRFNPARNAAGEPIPTTYGWRQRWWEEPQ